MKLKINDKIKIKIDEFTPYNLSQSKTAIVKEIIQKPTELHTRGAFPLLKVELTDKTFEILSFRFFELDEYKIKELIK